MQHLQHATRLAGDTAFSHHNIELIYFDMKKYDKALAAAHVSYALGFSRPDVRERLKGVGKWKDPEDKPSAPPVAGKRNASEPATKPGSQPN